MSLIQNPSSTISISLDCMGGDKAPHSVIEGAYIKSKQLTKKIKFLFFGDKEIVESVVKRYEFESEYEIHHAASIIQSYIKPSSVLRGIGKEFKDSSMVLAIKAVKNNQANVVVSSGNTGALMVASRVIIGMLSGIDRPAIISGIPNEVGGQVIMLDMGANIGSTTDDLLQLYLMGGVFARIILNKEPIRLALLNIGEEEIKGNDTIKNAYHILKDQKKSEHYKFCGYVESDSILKDKVDVVVCDGFIGNIALKAIEGTASTIKKYLAQAFRSSILARIGYLFARSSLKQTLYTIDPRNKNGAMLIGLNGIVIKSHGSADSIAFANAIGVAFELAGADINTKILNELEKEQEENLLLT
jgi:glycerol-3-phosphate acyltransferase PlsX